MARPTNSLLMGPSQFWTSSGSQLQNDEASIKHRWFKDPSDAISVGQSNHSINAVKIVQMPLHGTPTKKEAAHETQNLLTFHNSLTCSILQKIPTQPNQHQNLSPQIIYTTKNLCKCLLILCWMQKQWQGNIKSRTTWCVCKRKNFNYDSLTMDLGLADCNLIHQNHAKQATNNVKMSIMLLMTQMDHMTHPDEQINFAIQLTIWQCHDRFLGTWTSILYPINPTTDSTSNHYHQIATGVTIKGVIHEVREPPWVQTSKRVMMCWPMPIVWIICRTSILEWRMFFRVIECTTRTLHCKGVLDLRHTLLQ